MFLTPSQHCLSSVLDYDEPPVNQPKRAARGWKLEDGEEQNGKADESVGGKEPRDERKVTAASAQQMLQL